MTLPPLGERNFHLDADRSRSTPLTLPQLFTAGVECGHTEARVELKRRVEDVNAQLESFRAVRDKAQGDKEQLASELCRAQHSIATLQLETFVDADATPIICKANLDQRERARDRRARDVHDVADDGADPPRRPSSEGVRRARARTLAAGCGGCRNRLRSR